MIRSINTIIAHHLHALLMLSSSSQQQQIGSALARSISSIVERRMIPRTAILLEEQSVAQQLQVIGVGGVARAAGVESTSAPRIGRSGHGGEQASKSPESVRLRRRRRRSFGEKVRSQSHLLRSASEGGGPSSRCADARLLRRNRRCFRSVPEPLRIETTKEPRGSSYPSCSSLL